MKRFTTCILVTLVVLGICVGMCSCGETSNVSPGTKTEVVSQYTEDSDLPQNEDTSSTSDGYSVKPVEFSDDIFGDSPVTESQVLVDGLRDLFTSSCEYINKLILNDHDWTLESKLKRWTQSMANDVIVFNSRCKDEFNKLSDKDARSKYDKFYKKFKSKTENYGTTYTGDFADIVDFVDQFHEFIFGKELLNNSQRLALARKVLGV